MTEPTWTLRGAGTIHHFVAGKHRGFVDASEPLHWGFGTTDRMLDVGECESVEAGKSKVEELHRRRVYGEANIR